eukprot:1194362-Prorocentrum_minimum.AAC.2
MPVPPRHPTTLLIHPAYTAAAGNAKVTSRWPDTAQACMQRAIKAKLVHASWRAAGLLDS